MSQITVYFNKKTNERLDEKSRRYGLTRYALICQLIDAFINHPENFKPCYAVKVTEVQYKNT